jgi:ABC-type polysaccharide/polyol phosphate transport system ATPase subunit
MSTARDPIETQDPEVKSGIPSPIGISIKNLRAKWCPEGDEWTLDNVSMEVKEGQLVAVIGTVGASKVK